MTGSKYLIGCLSLTFGLMAAVAGFNYYADPCGIYHYGKSWDWIHNRPAISDMEFVHKARAELQAKADVLLLGSSRTAEGLDPHNPALPLRTYNLGLHHGTVYEAWRYLQNACAVHPPKIVVVGIDIAWFAASLESTEAFSEDRLLVQPDGRPTPTLTYDCADIASTLFSLPTFYLSLKTVFGHTKLNYDAGYVADGPRILEQMDLTTRILAANRKWIDPAHTTSYRGPNGETPQMDAFNQILTLCAQKNIHLIVFVHPLHALMMDRYTENWSVYSDWMKTAATRLESTPGLKAEFWDFAGYNSMSTEPFPLPTEKYSHTCYYWDGSHYHKIVGDLVLQRIFTGAGPATFGQLVTTATVDQDLQRLAAEKQAWHEHGQCVPISPPSTEPGPAANQGGP